MSGIPVEIRALLACPRCRGPLVDVAAQAAVALRCESCRLDYPVEQGIPVLLVERAQPVKPA
jgi:uncharacterized protein YbaR (Trm112 family)